MRTVVDIEIFYAYVASLGLRFPVADISKATGYDKSNVSKILNRKIPPSEDFIRKVYKSFKQSGKNVANEGLNLEVKEAEGDYVAQRRELKNGDKKVPVYGGFTTLGNIEVYDDDNMKNEVVAQLPAEVFPGCDYAEKAKGDSMYPLIMNQALLVGKKCSVRGISFGEKYIIKTKHGMDTVKFIHPGSKKNCIILKAYNKSVPDQEIEISDVVFSCRVHWIVNPT